MNFGTDYLALMAHATTKHELATYLRAWGISLLPETIQAHHRDPEIAIDRLAAVERDARTVVQMDDVASARGWLVGKGYPVSG